MQRQLQEHVRRLCHDRKPAQTVGLPWNPTWLPEQIHCPAKAIPSPA